MNIVTLFDQPRQSLSHQVEKPFSLCCLLSLHTRLLSLMPLPSSFPLPILLFPHIFVILVHQYISHSWSSTFLLYHSSPIKDVYPVISMITMWVIHARNASCEDTRDMHVQRHAHDNTELGVPFWGREGCQHQACNKGIYLILHDAVSSTVSMQAINLVMMTQNTHRDSCKHPLKNICSHSQKHLYTHMWHVSKKQPCTVVYSPGVVACSVMVVWNLLPPAEIKRITLASCHTSRGSKGNKNWLNLVWK